VDSRAGHRTLKTRITKRFFFVAIILELALPFLATFIVFTWPIVGIAMCVVAGFLFALTCWLSWRGKTK
jgi:hypothetical protein